jgi:beta-lactamase superfamily II metal-dependent hydrolase
MYERDIMQTREKGYFKKLKIKVLPANGGDCIIVSFGEEGSIKNILIDGGIGGTYKKLKKEIIEIKKAGQYIDLLVVTHSHEDHINGIIKFIEDDKNNDCIKKVWFNSGVHFNRKKVALLKQDNGTDISLRKIKTLEDKLIDMKFMGKNIWNSELVIQGDILELDGAMITVLTPNSDGLEKLKEFTKELRDTDIAGKDYDFSTRLSDFDLSNFEEDDSIENATSISFMFEYDEKRVLFLADALPSDVLEGLTKTGVLKQSKRVDCVKLAHHASRGNLNNELLEAIECSDYIVSTFGKSSNKLPNKETFARILQYSKNLNLYFNYKNEIIKGIFFEDELEDYNIDITYLSDNEHTIGI